ncbi:MAG TPA: SDR family NAD(P)-dependent oxidoreductase [Anaerolineales bacterium]|nr:SDR family NAD(P)-dependent oxidoreductase [Anaerolineales bacterium]
MKVFLTGGTGFIGQALTRCMLQRGWSVVALARRADSPRALQLRRMGAELTAGDVTNRESMRAEMQGADVVVHTAGMYEFGVDKAGAHRMREVNVAGTENVLRLAHELHIRRTVHVSSVKAFGGSGAEPRDETYVRQMPCRTIYEQSKVEAHEIARRYQQLGSPVIIVCPNQVIGANDHSVFGYLLRAYVNGVMPPAAWGPDSTISYVDVDDAAVGIALAVEKGRDGETYLLCGEPQTLKQTLTYWNTKPGGLRARAWLPAWLAAALVAPLEPLQRKLGLPAVLSRESVRAGSTSWNYSSAKARFELGWGYRCAEDLWTAAFEAELRLLAQRKKQRLLERLKPLESTAGDEDDLASGQHSEAMAQPIRASE